MSGFPDADNTGRQRIRVAGRGIFCTNSAKVEFVSEYGREAFPLVNTGSITTTLLAGNLVWSFAYELDGHILIVATANFNNLNAGPYRHLQVPANGTLAPVERYTVFVPVINSAQFGTAQHGADYRVAQLNITYYDSASVLQTVVLNTLTPVSTDFITPYLTAGNPFVIPPGWSESLPVYQWPPIIDYVAGYQPAGNGTFNSVQVYVSKPNGDPLAQNFTCSPPVADSAFPFVMGNLYEGPTAYPGFTLI